MAARVAQYRLKLEQWTKENENDEDDVKELDIKSRINGNRTDGAIKIDQELLSEAFRWRLSQNDCQNRGYIIDGYPISYETSKQVFYIPGKAPDPPKEKFDDDGNPIPNEEEPLGEEELAALLAPKFQGNIYPDSVILIRGEDNYIRQHAKSLTKEANTKWDPENLNRRLEKWSENNNLNLYRLNNNADDLGWPNAKVNKLPITRFFQEHNTEVFEIACNRN